ncbi:3-beta hydroxysteroid dehydrogenase isomerase family [Mycena kentingensis (nom. inval.)]|nr:3-beta hydroxysteroid dehydrogenase isomerase family [Mycena kentingensis (nom. inval.)]
MSDSADSLSTFSSSSRKAPATIHTIIEGLRRYAPPTDDYSAQLRSGILATESELARYEEEIAAAKSLLERLTSERDALDLYLRASQSAFSPARRLPPEVLLRIFAFVVETQDWREYSPSSSIRQRQSGLPASAQVCWHWRQLIVDTRSLWTNIVIDCFREGKEPILGPLSRRLRYSRPSALNTLSFSLRFRYYEGLDALQLLVQHAHAWSSVSIIIAHPSFFLDSYLLPAKGKLYNLHSLELVGDIVTESLDVFEDAPKLTRVVFSKNPPRLPWSQLRRVVRRTLSTVQSLGGTFDFLARCSTACEVHFPRLEIGSLYARDDPLPDERVHSNLRAFVVGFSHTTIKESDTDHGTERILGHLLDTLHTPNLRNLTFHLNMDWDVRAHSIFFPGKAFISFTTRSPNLSSLFLYDIRITPDQLLLCLAHTPDLERLLFQDIVYEADDDDATIGSYIALTDEVVERLSQVALLVPRLVDLRIAGVFEDIQDATFLACVRARVDQARTRGLPFSLQITTLSARKPESDVVGMQKSSKAEHLRALLKDVVREGGLALTFVPECDLKAAIAEI